ncbi:SemiSWEET transporter [Parvibaculum sp.]|uniref:SemiSWEET transporter n=1 Tax=Parvibaculum sp. TaxID=2024848 RepID=UPI002C1111E4|nr:SemiSWEET transporter [Parvibaculum sp.]HUD51697.1 SemiSWEET transporter [Parvibaculum sp.]
MYLGYAAAFLTTVAFLPQALKTIKTRNTDGISVLMYAGFVTGVLCWLLYGLMLRDAALIAGNAVTFVLALPIFIIALTNHVRARRAGKRL